MVRYLPFVLLAGACLPTMGQDVLLVPDSTSDRVWAFSASDGSLVDDSFIVDPGADDGFDVFNRPLEVLIGLDSQLYVCDQFADVVSEFNSDGSFVGIFSLGGVRDDNIMNNIRGGHVLTAGAGAGDVLVTNSGPFNDLAVSQNNVKRLNSGDGAEKEDFAFNRYGGIRGPFDVIEYNGEVLVADEGQDKIVRYTLDGKFNERFTSALAVPLLDFPQQMAATADGNLLVCAFSTGYILEFDSTGALVGQFQAGLELFRGVCELDSGNLMVTTTTGVFEVTRAGVFVRTIVAGDGFRYITRFTPPAGLLIADDEPELTNTRTEAMNEQTEKPAPDQRSKVEIIADERGMVSQRSTEVTR